MLAVVFEQMTKHIVTAVNPFKHEFAQAVHGVFHSWAHGKMRLAFAAGDHIHDHCVDPIAVGFAKNLQAVRGNGIRPENAASQGVVQVMIQVGNPVRPTDTFRFRCFRLNGAGMRQNTAADFLCQVQAGTVFLKLFHHTEALLVVTESLGKEIVEGAFTDMSVRGVTEIVSEGNGFSQVLVETERAGNGPCDLGYFERVR